MPLRARHVVERVHLADAGEEGERTDAHITPIMRDHRVGDVMLAPDGNTVITG